MCGIQNKLDKGGDEGEARHRFAMHDAESKQWSKIAVLWVARVGRHHMRGRELTHNKVLR